LYTQRRPLIYLFFSSGQIFSYFDIPQSIIRFVPTHPLFPLFRWVFGSICVLVYLLLLFLLL